MDKKKRQMKEHYVQYEYEEEEKKKAEN